MGTDANVMILATAMPSPADVGLIRIIYVTELLFNHTLYKI
jgi:hypothetical protein